jgi:large subunit ribosomal protein L19
LSKELSWLTVREPNPNVPSLSPGDTVKVRFKIREKEKQRTQVFEGIVLKIKKGGNSASFTVRHISYGIGVERTFPLHSPLLEKVEVVQQAKVRRAKLFYLRGLSSKAVRAKLKPKTTV